MEPIFVCEFTPTVPMIAARIWKYSKARCAFLLIVGIGVFAYIVSSAVISAMMYGLDSFWMGFLIFSLAFLAYCVFFPRITAYFSIRNYKKDTSGDNVYRIAFGDRIEIIQGSIRTTWEYSDITKIYRLKHSYDLVKTERLSLIVDPNGFTKGTFEDFKKFLKEKRPDLTVPE